MANLLQTPAPPAPPGEVGEELFLVLLDSTETQLEEQDSLFSFLFQNVFPTCEPEEATCLQTFSACFHATEQLLCPILS